MVYFSVLREKPRGLIYFSSLKMVNLGSMRQNWEFREVEVHLTGSNNHDKTGQIHIYLHTNCSVPPSTTHVSTVLPYCIYCSSLTDWHICILSSIRIKPRTTFSHWFKRIIMFVAVLIKAPLLQVNFSRKRNRERHHSTKVFPCVGGNRLEPGSHTWQSRQAELSFLSWSRSQFIYRSIWKHKAKSVLKCQFFNCYHFIYDIIYNYFHFIQLFKLFIFIHFCI